MIKQQDTIPIDGALGEGGGQVLRTALSLSTVTGQGFRITNIRASRRKPGLMRQHLACVKAAAQLCNANVSGMELNSTDVTFIPGQAGALPGTYHFSIGSAGSTGMVLQTVLPPLLMATGNSTVTIEGGTINPLAPSYPFLSEVFLPLLRRMGASIGLQMVRPGFVPAGGGLLCATTEGTGKLGSLSLMERGNILKVVAHAVRAGGIPGSVPERELNVIASRLKLSPENLIHHTLSDAGSPGNYCSVTVISQNITELFMGIGERRRRAEAVANDVTTEAEEYISSGVPVGPHLADQLLLPMALGEGGAFISSAPTLHTTTNIQVIQQFLPVEITTREVQVGAWLIEIKK